MISSRCRLDSAFKRSLARSAADSMIVLSIFIPAYIRLFAYTVKRRGRRTREVAVHRGMQPTEAVMSEVVVIGAGLSGTLMAYELLPQLRKGDHLTVVSQGPVYHFVPSNPWVAIGWRKRGDIEIDLAEIMKRKGIRLLTQGAQRVHPAEN